MKKLNSKGFTLVELIAVITILGIVATIGGISVSSIMGSSRKKQYELLVSNVEKAVESYYMECTYGRIPGNNYDWCATPVSGVYTVNVSTLIENGFINPNSGNILLNPDTENTKFCKISYEYDSSNDEIKINQIIEESDLNASGC